jgi:hypothetical protein
MTVRNVCSHASVGCCPRRSYVAGRPTTVPTTSLALSSLPGCSSGGFSLAAIEAVAQHTPASSAEQALAFYRGILAPWQPEEPLEMSYAELTEWLGVELQPATLDRLHLEGDLERVGPDRVRITNPSVVAGRRTGGAPGHPG